MSSGPRETTEAALRRLRQHFVANLSSTTAQLETLAASVEPGPDADLALTALGQQLHRLRGTAGTFGFVAAAALAADMESQVQIWQAGDTQDDAGHRSARVRRFIQEFARACGAT